MKILSCVFKITPGKPQINAKKIIEIADKEDADILLFPAYALTGVSCGQLLNFKFFDEEVEAALNTLCVYTESSKKVIITSTHKYGNIAIFDGDINNTGKFNRDGKSFSVSTDIEEKSDIILLPTAMPGYPCIKNDIIEYCAAASQKNNCLVAVANAGFGESSADDVFKGFAGVFKNGIINAFMAQDSPDTIVAAADFDKTGGLIYSRPNRADMRVPYYGKNDPKLYIEDLFFLQTQALYTKLESTNLKPVISLSLDISSLLALLVCVSAVKMRGQAAKDISTFITYASEEEKALLANIILFAKKLGVSVFETDISQDLSLSLSKEYKSEKDEAFTQKVRNRIESGILLNFADNAGAIVVGSLNLSDEALGKLTFGAENTCHYNVNATVPKTLVKKLLDFKEMSLDESLKLAFNAAVADCEKREDNSFSYELVDFIIYYFAKQRLSEQEIKQYALATFDDLDEDEIDNCLQLLFKNYPKSQFMRSASAEGANLIGFILPYIPSDIYPQFIIGE